MGHLFQGRYKAILVEKGGHLLELSRYVVLNPVRAKMVKRPEQYRWSSYRGTVGYRREQPWLSTDWILGQFGVKRQEAVERYKKFVWEGIGKKKPWDNLIGQIYYGSKEFVKKLKIKGDEELKEIPRAHKQPPDSSTSACLSTSSRTRALACRDDSLYRVILSCHTSPFLCPMFSCILTQSLD